MAESLGVLLANLGTPDAPTPAAVRRYLAEFLSDPRVIDYPRFLWLPILYAIILRVRPPKTAHAYSQIWTPEGSPLLVTSKAIAQALQSVLGAAQVELGMTYGSPSIASALQSLRQKNIRRLIVLPMYPQFSTTTTLPVRDRVDAALNEWPDPPKLHFIERYYDNSKFLDLLAESIRQHWERHGRKHLLFSFHGIPQRYVANGDPYYAHCVATARATVERLGLAAREWTLAFQSRVTREKWLEPYTDRTLLEFARTGPKELSVVCPAFATDNLETLEEIAIRNRADFLAAGGHSLDYIPCLNDDPGHVALFAELVHRATTA